MPVDAVSEVPVEDLHEWEKNPRQISDERLAALGDALVKERDLLRARPVIALRDGRVIAGNMRLRAAKALGWDSIPTTYVDLDEERAAQWALLDNAGYGTWDDTALAGLLNELHAANENLDLSLTGFSMDDLALLPLDFDLPGVEQNGAPEDRGDDLALADVSIGDPKHEVKKGEVWNVGPHVLICAGVYDDWAAWSSYLTGDVLFVPYPTPTLPLTTKAEQFSLVMVQPDPWLAGHLLDKYVAVKGADGVKRA